MVCVILCFDIGVTVQDLVLLSCVFLLMQQCDSEKGLGRFYLFI